MKAADIMTTKVVSVSETATVRETAKLLLTHGISAVPVVDGAGRPVGMVSEGDLMRRREAGTERHAPWWLRAITSDVQSAKEFTKARGLTARDVMTRDVVQITEDTPLNEIAALLEAHAIKRVPVIHGGRVVGIVSRANLIRALTLALPAAPTPDDRELRARVLGALDEQPWEDAIHPTVAVKDGVVHIWAVAPSREQGEALRVAVENVPGVRGLELNVAVRPKVPYFA